MSSPNFSDQALRLILERLPDNIDARRRENEWSKHDLQISLSRPDPVAIKKKIVRLRKVVKHASSLSKTLDEFDKANDDLLIYGLLKANSLPGFQKEIDEQKHLLDQQSEFLSTLLSSAHKLISALKSQLDQRRNIPAYRVMQDIAAIFEWLTGRRAVRRVERGNDTFGDFARAIWPVILNRADD